mmetsp:Transcript_10020/g.9956  ORF Transcript_10020/g.9956 Transcript_10020/m.9956 type:complete len:113 (+) Transcript_10020:594-932(+)
MGLFKKIDALADQTYFFKVKKEELNKHLQWYYFLGQIVGKAMFDGIPIYFPMCKSVLKHLIFHDYKPILDDLKYFDPFIHNSIKMIKDNNLSDEELLSLNLNFQVEVYDDKG